MKQVSYLLAILDSLMAGVYFNLTHNPQKPEQQAMDESGITFADEIKSLDLLTVLPHRAAIKSGDINRAARQYLKSQPPAASRSHRGATGRHEPTSRRRLNPEFKALWPVMVQRGSSNIKEGRI